ncbi:uncharacterized protein VP01_360g4 [Puccinia sorghi]|uniref:hAT-like transposase RNase-H fold domain-containing protein n=1 Tax=Puccinia sorghi TaxID=27349 RepID=A0A0L6UV03_9BASI|nr:uncharacterized protein VP01_360g4 [Puccinia sorghi]
MLKGWGGATADPLVPTSSHHPPCHNHPKRHGRREQVTGRQTTHPLKPAWAANSSTCQSQSIVIDIDIKDKNDPQEPRAQSLKLTICQVILKNNRKCGSKLKKDQSGSTNNFHKHLLKIHHLVNPKLSQKIDKSQKDIAKWIKTSKFAPKVYSDLPFSLVERPAFKNILMLLTHLSQMYLCSQEKIKLEFLAKQDSVGFTQDAWTANMTAFMAVTSHFINRKLKMYYFTLAIPKHTGKKFSDLFYKVLQDFNLLSKLHTITTNHVSTNSRMACDHQLELPLFETTKHLLVCIAHMINLGAKAGLEVLGSLEDEEKEG